MVDAVTRLRRVEGTPDRYGNPTYTDESEALPAALFAPKDVIRGVEQGSEVGREPVVVEPTLYWRGLWPDVIASDRLVVRGVTYEVATQPADWRNVSVGGLVVKLRNVSEGTP